MATLFERIPGFCRIADNNAAGLAPAVRSCRTFSLVWAGNLRAVARDAISCASGGLWLGFLTVKIHWPSALLFILAYGSKGHPQRRVYDSRSFVVRMSWCTPPPSHFNHNRVFPLVRLLETEYPWERAKFWTPLDDLFRGAIHAFRRRKHALVGQQGFKSVHRLDMIQLYNSWNVIIKIIEGALIRGVSIYEFRGVILIIPYFFIF